MTYLSNDFFIFYSSNAFPHRIHVYKCVYVQQCKKKPFALMNRKFCARKIRQDIKSQNKYRVCFTFSSQRVSSHSWWFFSNGSPKVINIHATMRVSFKPSTRSVYLILLIVPVFITVVDPIMFFFGTTMYTNRRRSQRFV